MANIEYESKDGEYTTEVDRLNKKVIAYERGGWSRDYKLTFDELIKYAQQWDVPLDLNDNDQTVAEIATNIIRANNSAEHGLDPFRYVSRTNKITEPKDVKTIQDFQKLLEKYTPEQISNLLHDDTKFQLQQVLIKKEN